MSGDIVLDTLLQLVRDQSRAIQAIAKTVNELVRGEPSQIMCDVFESQGEDGAKLDALIVQQKGKP